MEADNESYVFIPMESEENSPLSRNTSPSGPLFTESLETSKDCTVKEDEVQETAKERLLETSTNAASTSAQKPASTKRKKMSTSAERSAATKRKKTKDRSLCSREKRVKCPECLRYTAETEEKMARHIRKVHRGENPFQCYMCDYSTYNNVRFEEHIRKHQGIKPFKCTECDYSSASRKNLKKHELKHKPDYPLKCGTCGFIGQHKTALKAHMRTHANATGDNNIQPNNNATSLDYPCNNCTSKFKSAEALHVHKKNKRKCLECDMILCTKTLLIAHDNLYHADKKDNRSIKYNFICQVCGWISVNTAKILLHLIHHPKQLVDESVLDISILRKYDIME